MRYAAWIGTSLITLVSLALTVFPVLASTGRWIALAFFIVCVGILLTLPIGSQGGLVKRLVRSIGGQHITASDDARVVQGGNDVTIRGGMGDRS